MEEVKQKFKPGDQVQLKSGGPKMTVNNYNSVSGPYLNCHWMPGNKLESGTFHQDALQPYVAPPKPAPL